MSQPFIYVANFFCGALAFCLLLQWFVLQRKKTAMGKEFHLCIHCEKMVEKGLTNHWEECEKHPARRMLHAIRVVLNVRSEGDIEYLTSFVDDINQVCELLEYPDRFYLVQGHICRIAVDMAKPGTDMSVTAEVTL